MHKSEKQIPRDALRLAMPTQLAIGDNGEGSKTAPVKMLARTGEPIEHWYWGKLVHDMKGMKLHKKRLAIDYVHDPDQIIGYLNKFDATNEGLTVSGALTPYGDKDRASEILHKAKAGPDGEGVPYEASIDWYGDGIVVEYLSPNATAEVNGYTLTGPAAIIREWPLRSVAICPYGGDMNTNTQLKGDSAAGHSVAVTTLSQEPEMTGTTTSPVAGTPTPDTTTLAKDPKGGQKPAAGTVDAGTVTPPTGATQLTIDKAKASSAFKLAVEAGLIPADKSTDEAGFITKLTTEIAPAVVDVTKLSAKEYGDTFGDIGYRWHAEGKSFHLAASEHITKLAADHKTAIEKRDTEITELTNKLAAIPRGDTGVSSGMPPGGNAPPAQLVAAVGENVARLAAGMKMPTDSK